MTHILVSAPFSEELIENIRSVSHEITVEQFVLPDGVWPVDRHTDAEIVYTTSDVPPAELAPNLRWVQSHWTGIDKLSHRPIWDLETIITTASGVHARAIAQHLFSKILFFANRVPKWQAFKQSKTWPKNRQENFSPIELQGKTLGILGYGSMGREVARIGNAFGMNVLATKRNLKKTSEGGFRMKGAGDPEGKIPLRLYPGEATRSMVAECDFVVVTLPLTAKTHGLVNSSLLKAMKPTAYLFNAARGQIVVEADLITALNKGWIAGAGLDVYSQEPLLGDSPLWKMENVLMSPHVAGLTDSYNARAVDLFSENLRRYLVGEPLLNLVNREYGY
ncbi:MAG: phosphoglycerate dehydrogenase-like enzyme [Cellvibrionaceae bacterium]|jgi:phosphoglycerate dehydrogenase-like enzyme